MSDVQDIGPVFDIPEDTGAANPPEDQDQIQPTQEEATPQPAEADPQPVETPEEGNTQEAQGGHNVPLTALLDEREKRQALKRERDELEQRLQALEAQRQPQPQAQIPDPYEDPAGYQQYIQAQIDERAFAATAEISGRFAEQKYGKETVEEAVRWAQAQGAKDPTLGQRVRLSNDPVGFVVEQFQREQFWTKYGSDPSAIQTLMATPPTAAPQMAAPAAPKPIAPPRSLAAAPGAGGGHQSIPDGSVLDSVKFNLD